MLEEKIVKMVYRNWKGIEATRRVIPVYGGIYWRKSEFHPEKAQWILQVYDCDKRELRDFAFKDIIKIIKD